MAHWHLIHTDGAEAFVQTKRGQHPSDAGYGEGWTATRLKRAPTEHSRMIDGRLTIDQERRAAAIDAGHGARHGQHAIAIARATKATEARLMLAGVPIDGLIATEARATGQEPAVLARIVAAAADAADQHEIERIVAKRRLRASSRSK